VADIVRAVEGPLVWVRDERPGALGYEGAATVLMPLWVGLRASVRNVLEGVSLADLANGELPEHVTKLTADPMAWQDP
jgi:DNA-binding IscR family transcriptional regulator